MNAADSTSLAGETYRKRLVHSDVAMPNDKILEAQEGYQSKLARDAAGRPDSSEYYKMGDMIGGRYEVFAIHQGGMGVVYGCFDHQTKLPIALKTVRARHASDKQMLSLFNSEATIWVSLEKHPYIVRAYQVKFFDNLPYVIAEYICGPKEMGGDLRGWLGHPILTLPVAVRMALQIAQGMQYAVRKVPNLVHRDLKPGNILVNGDGRAMVTDFGLVNAAQSGAGTPAYMSPEQWCAEALDPRSDIYSYGCILFEMFTSYRLFPALTERDWKIAHLESMPAALTSLVPQLPVEIDRFVLGCLEKDPKVRPQNWDEAVTFFSEWYCRLTGNAVRLDFSSLELNADELAAASSSFFYLNRYEECLSACNRAIAIDPNNAAAWTNMGGSLCMLNRDEEGLSAYNRSLAIDPNNAGVWMNMGNVLYFLNRYEEALQAYAKALAISPNYADALNCKGNALRTLTRYEEAIQALNRALEIFPNYALAWNNKGLTLHDLNRHDEAVQAYDRALVINQNFADAWNNKGIALCYLRRYDEAIQAYDRALAINSNYADSWNDKGGALSGLNRYAEAIQAYDRALEIDPNYADAWYNKGNAFYGLKRYEEAINAYDQALAIDPNNLDARNNKNLAVDNVKRQEEKMQPLDRPPSINQKTVANHGGELSNLNNLCHLRAIEMIKKNFGSIRDLPKLMWPVIWVTTYRACEVAMKIEPIGGSNAIVKRMLIGDSSDVYNLDSSIRKVELIKKFIQLIRQSKSEIERLGSSSLLIDILKWNITNAGEMSNFRRMIARQFAKSDPLYEYPIPDEIL